MGPPAVSGGRTGELGTGGGAISYEVAHALPGRVRLRLKAAGAEHGPALARAFGAMQPVRSARWNGAARCLVVAFDPELTFGEVVETLRGRPAEALDGSRALDRGQAANGQAAGGEDRRSPPLLAQFMLPAVSLAAGFSGLGLLARAVVAVCAIPVARRALESARDRRLTVDVLDFIAIGLLLGTGDTVAAGATVALVETGERIRHRAYGRARHVLRSWMGANPGQVRIQRNGSEPRVPLPSITVGERVVLYAGENVPVDGVVISGSGSVDMRTWTGEPMPHASVAGSAVLAGSALADGRIVVEVTATGDETRAGRMSIALEEALAANTQVADMARRVADRFVAPVLIASGLVLASTRSLTRAIAMLIFDYGTGVRIAIPTTILTTMIAGGRHAVLFKNGRAIEELARADTVVFDKTGTLTSGVLRMLRMSTAPGLEESEVLRLAAAAEGHLPHPVAGAVRRAARSRQLELPEPEWVRYQPGGGVHAIVEGRRVTVGDRRLLDAAGIEVPREARADPLFVLVAVDGRYAASIRLQDEDRESARQVVQGLRRSGVGTLLLASGDHPATVRAVSMRLGLDGFSARLMPEDKARLVRRLRAEGRRVGVVGDGMNDAPAMAEADVSVAVPRGADLARETADIVLLSEDLADLIAARHLAQTAMRVVRENIALVAAPNSAGMLLAGLGSLTPLGAALINNGSTVFAGLNALRPLRALPARRT